MDNHISDHTTIVSDAALKTAQSVDKDRQWSRLMQLAEIGAIPGGGVNRQSLSTEDRQARALLVRWALARGFEPSVDDFGNLYVRRSGRNPEAPPILTGSHLDSQPSGGRFDGAYGVMAALEVLEALSDSNVETEHPVELVVWTNEEGSRFAPGAMGSMVFTGKVSPQQWLDVTDDEGTTLSQALMETLDALPGLPRRPFGFPVHAYIEAHIEQGPILEAEHLSIGVVTSIQGVRWFTVTVIGETAHAGTTPLRLRKDALQDALAAIQALNTFMNDSTDVLRFTIGRLVLEPNSHNSVSALCRFTIDLRHPDPSVLRAKGDAIEGICIDAMRACTVQVTQNLELPCVAFPEAIVDAVQTSAQALVIGHRRMPSGAFHDASFLATHCPSGMIFVPCAKGLSHNVAESISPEDAAIGTQVLAATIVELSRAINLNPAVILDK
ncbi:M20 family metallo-hydrolase [Acidithiobacillus thiooxidans]|uniref:M20 family metallo-hydrolase n=1 Tax=Acidithiobacillus thiooxidans TaxID=930 RepID=UPI001C06E098|nr:M20 family metallo-hydrolase [Acidithiobacillus thiooxidans]MBU2750138.1 M20 family metallo-hydrolase [Acidithiobacillus thiooxidans]